MNLWSLLDVTLQEARAALDEAGIDCAMITLNGAQVLTDPVSRFYSTNSKSQAMTVMDILDANGIYYEVATNQGLYSESQPKRIEKLCFFDCDPYAPFDIQNGDRHGFG